MPVSEFKSQVLQWPQRKEGMGIAVVNRKAADLPAWAFPDGVNPLAPQQQQPQPQQPQQPKAEEQAEAGQEVRARRCCGRGCG
jgi:hypothetical protein